VYTSSDTPRVHASHPPMNSNHEYSFMRMNTNSEWLLFVCPIHSLPTTMHACTHPHTHTPTTHRALPVNGYQASPCTHHQLPSPQVTPTAHCAASTGRPSLPTNGATCGASDVAPGRGNHDAGWLPTGYLPGTGTGGTSAGQASLRPDTAARVLDTHDRAHRRALALP
jgi:hypothetical protein